MIYNHKMTDDINDRLIGQIEATLTNIANSLDNMQNEIKELRVDVNSRFLQVERTTINHSLELVAIVSLKDQINALTIKQNKVVDRLNGIDNWRYKQIGMIIAGTLLLSWIGGPLIFKIFGVHI